MFWGLQRMGCLKGRNQADDEDEGSLSRDRVNCVERRGKIERSAEALLVVLPDHPHIDIGTDTCRLVARRYP